MKKEDFNWPGWNLESNPFGEEFDLNARKRMIEGSKKLLPLIEKYSKKIDSPILEVGPFFKPLITPKLFPGKKIFYWENDKKVIEYLKKEFKENQIVPIYCDLNKLEGTSLLKLKAQTLIEMKIKGIKSDKFGSVIVSHVFNYIDYKLFLFIIKDFMKENGLIFINNAVDYGLPKYFSEKRPKSIDETVESIKEAGFEIVEKKVLDSPNKKHQKNKRLILAAKMKRKK